MRTRHQPPLAVPAAGCGGTGPELARFGDLTRLDAVLLGPVAEPTGVAPANRPVLRPVPGALVHSPATAIPVDRVVGEHLPWLAARGCPVVVALRGRSGGAVAELAQRLRRSLDFGAVAALELDLRGAPSTDPQECLRLLARLREAAPRDLPLAAKLGPDSPDLVAAARAAVAGGAAWLVVSGAVPARPEDAWLVGPAVAPVTERLVGQLQEAMGQGRVPQVPVVASGGVTDEASAVRLAGMGASGVQVGTALFADPTVLWRVHDALARGPAAGPQHGTDDMDPVEVTLDVAGEAGGRG